VEREAKRFMAQTRGSKTLGVIQMELGLVGGDEHPVPRFPALAFPFEGEWFSEGIDRVGGKSRDWRAFTF
jgi:hypothetical protein